MASGSNTTFGASIVPVEQRAGTHAAPTTSLLDSPAITPAASHEDLAASAYQQQHIPPSSPLYNSPAQLEPIHTRQSSRPSMTATEKDLEAGHGAPFAAEDDNPFTSKVSVDCNKECAMWPSKQTLMEKKKAEQKRKRAGKHFRGCAPVVETWQRFNARQKLIMKIVLALFLIGVMVAIAVGISVAVNGTVYVSENRSSRIPDPDSR